MDVNRKIQIVLAMLQIAHSTMAAPAAEYRVEEQGNNLILITPDGRRILFGEHNLHSEKSYQFEIPLSELTDEKAAGPANRAPASVAKPDGEPTPTPFYDVDWDWEEPDEDKSLVAVPTVTPIPTPKVDYDGNDNLILKANRLFHKGKYYEAALYVEELIRRKPDSLRAWLMKGSVFFKLGQKDLAKQAWAQAAKLDKDSKETKGLMERFK